MQDLDKQLVGFGTQPAPILAYDAGEEGVDAECHHYASSPLHSCHTICNVHCIKRQAGSRLLKLCHATPLLEAGHAVAFCERTHPGFDHGKQRTGGGVAELQEEVCQLQNYT